MADPTGMTATGGWTNNNYESESDLNESPLGMVYRAGAHLNPRVDDLANRLQALLTTPDIEMDNPKVLAEISALNGHYNSARQAQSSLMKAIKDTSQSIIRNM